MLASRGQRFVPSGQKHNGKRWDAVQHTLLNVRWESFGSRHDSSSGFEGLGVGEEHLGMPPAVFCAGVLNSAQVRIHTPPSEGAGRCQPTVGLDGRARVVGSCK